MTLGITGHVVLVGSRVQAMVNRHRLEPHFELDDCVTHLQAPERAALERAQTLFPELHE